MRFIVFFLGLLIYSNVINAQVIQPDSLMTKITDFKNHLLYKDHDSTYIKSYAENLNIKLLAINKINNFHMDDRNADVGVRYRPDRRINLGLGISYKWFSLDLAFNVGIKEKSNLQESKFFDFQGTVFSSKQYISSTIQYYYGYQLAGYNGFFVQDKNDIARDDIRTTLFVLQYLFAINYDKFSLKAPFIFNEIQKKSAGSFLLGASFKTYNMAADSSLVPSTNISNNPLPILDVNCFRFGINAGYMHTFVFQKHYFVTVSLIPELGYTMGDYKTDYRKLFNNHLSMGISTMNAVGYNGDRFYTGFQFISESFSLPIGGPYSMNVGNGKIKAFVGYRFGVKKE